MNPNLRYFFIGLLLPVLLMSCQDNITVADTNQKIQGKNWSYTEKIIVPVEILSNDMLYNVFVNIRHTGDYRYSNMFILVHLTDPKGKKTTERKELTLALADGEWLGSGSGNMYSYQIPIKENFKFPSNGKYIFELEQNMRDNPLNHVTDAGIRVEKAENK